MTDRPIPPALPLSLDEVISAAPPPTPLGPLESAFNRGMEAERRRWVKWCQEHSAKANPTEALEAMDDGTNGVGGPR